MQGLYNKYTVTKTNGEPVDPNAHYFVLRVDKAPHAREAMMAYAESVREENPQLAADISRMVRIAEIRQQAGE